MIIHIDELSIRGMKIHTRGYVISETSNVKIRINNQEIIPCIMRTDVNIAFQLPDNYLAGFDLKRSIFTPTKLYFSDDRETHTMHLGLLKVFKNKTLDYLRFINKKRKEYGYLGVLKVCLKKIFIRKSTNEQIYQNWIKKNMSSEKELEQQRMHNFNYQPKFSIVMPTYNTPITFLKELFNSVEGQTYKNWELCIADASENEEVKLYLKEKQCSNIKVVFLNENLMISRNTNEALKICEGEFVVLLDHDDILSPNALYEIVSVLNKNKKYDFIYSDEDKINSKGDIYSQPHFKQDFAIDTLRSYNYITHLVAIRKSLLDKIGYFDSACDGAQDYDLFLRICDETDRIYHIPKVLYHWRMHQASTSATADVKPYVLEAGKRALRKHLDRNNIKGKVSDGLFLTSYKIDYEIIGQPLISILIPNKDHISDLKRCLTSILNKSCYPNYEVVIIENNSVEKGTFEYYNKIKSDKIRVVTWNGPFNYSKINNYGRKFCKGEFLVLLNNDVEVINRDWLEEMLMHAQRKEIGAVGAKLYYPNGSIQHAGVIIGIGSVAGHSHKYYAGGEFGYMGRLKIVQNLSAVTAACMMMRASIYDEMNGFCDDFAVAFNDVDLCLRIREKGYLIIFTPYSELIHYESLSRGEEDSPEKVRRFQGEINLFEKKWGLYRYDPYYSKNLTIDKEDFSYRIS